MLGVVVLLWIAQLLKMGLLHPNSMPGKHKCEESFLKISVTTMQPLGPVKATVRLCTVIRKSCLKFGELDPQTQHSKNRKQESQLQ